MHQQINQAARALALATALALTACGGGDPEPEPLAADCAVPTGTSWPAAPGQANHDVKVPQRVCVDTGAAQ